MNPLLLHLQADARSDRFSRSGHRAGVPGQPYRQPVRAYPFLRKHPFLPAHLGRRPAPTADRAGDRRRPTSQLGWLLVALGLRLALAGSDSRPARPSPPELSPLPGTPGSG